MDGARLVSVAKKTRTTLICVCIQTSIFLIPIVFVGITYAVWIDQVTTPIVAFLNNTVSISHSDEKKGVFSVTTKELEAAVPYATWLWRLIVGAGIELIIVVSAFCIHGVAKWKSDDYYQIAALVATITVIVCSFGLLVSLLLVHFNGEELPARMIGFIQHAARHNLEGFTQLQVVWNCTFTSPATCPSFIVSSVLPTSLQLFFGGCIVAPILIPFLFALKVSKCRSSDSSAHYTRVTNNTSIERQENNFYFINGNTSASPNSNEGQTSRNRDPISYANWQPLEDDDNCD